MFTGMLHTHTLTVVIFLLLYLIKTILLVVNKKESLQNFRKKTLVAEMIVSTIFLLTGIYLAFYSGEVRTGYWFWVKLAIVLMIIPVGVISFKKENKVLAVMGLLMIVYVYGMSETKSVNFKREALKKTADTSGTMRPIATLQEKLTVGNILYREKCISCHGGDGKLGLSGSKDLTKSVLPQADVMDIIRNGKGVMPAYRDLFSEQEVEVVATYVESLRK